MSDKQKAIIWDFSGTLVDSRTKELFDGAKEVLEKASKKYKQAMVTTKLSDPKGRIQLLKDLDIYKYFSIVKISLKTKEIFLEICKEFECKPEEVYVIGDGYSFGIYPKEIMVGNQLDMKTIWTDHARMGKLKQKLMGVKYWKRVESLRELESILF